jgi:hypothetical protein
MVAQSPAREKLFIPAMRLVAGKAAALTRRAAVLV